MNRYTRFHICPQCERILSIAEQVERFCEGCKAKTDPKEVGEAA